MGGDLAQLPDLLDHILSRGAVPAGRVVVRGSNSGPANNGSQPARNATHDTALLGAYMASRNMLVSDGFSLVTGDITQALSNEHRAHSNLAHAGHSSSAAPGRAFSVVAGSFVREKAATPIYDDITPPPVKKSNGERAR
jgi:hypothetical protein